MTVTKFNIYNQKDGHSAINLLGDSIDWTTDIKFNPGELNFTLKYDGQLVPKFGDAIAFAWDGINVFFGYVFKIGYTRDGDFAVTAYDKMRYLKNQDTIVWGVSTASERFEHCVKAMGIGSAYKVLDRANIKLPARLDDGKTYFDMIQTAIEDEHRQSGNRYFVRGNWDKVEFLWTGRTYSGLVIGNKSLAQSWNYEASIDEAANVIKVIKKKDEKIKQTATATGDTVKTWGRLQRIENADEKDNAVQMQSKANKLLKQFNKPTKTLQVPAIGNLEIRAGTNFVLDIAALKAVGIGRSQVTAEKVTHHFGQDWSMDIEVER